MRQMKRAFAMLLCVAMVLSLCMTYAGAENILYYYSLDEIPEDAAIFRVLRTGKYYSINIHGHLYYQFSNENYIIRIPATAFSAGLTDYSNYYLREDNAKLSENCKNAPPENPPEYLKDGGAYRVCYYKTMSRSTRNGEKDYLEDVYTFSMYRLELKANAILSYPEQNISKGKIVYTEARLTSGVTFDFIATHYHPNQDYTKVNLIRRDEKIPLRPSVAVTVNNNSQDVHLIGFDISGVGPRCNNKDLVELASLTWSGIGCAKGIVAIFTAPELAITEAISTGVDCAWFLGDVVKTVQGAVNRKYAVKNVLREVYNQPLMILSPGKLANNDDYVSAIFYLNTHKYDSSKTDVKVEFNFA